LSTRNSAVCTATEELALQFSAMAFGGLRASDGRRDDVFGW
jgi:hypothetical protein